MGQHAGYMNRAFTDRFALVSEADELLANVDFDTFAAIGISGTLVAPLLADMGKGNHGFAIVRKKDSSHSTYLYEGDLMGGDKFVFVDDLVDSGSTLIYVLDKLEASFPGCPVKMVGAYLYQDSTFYTISELIQKLTLRATYSITTKLCIDRLERYL